MAVEISLRCLKDIDLAYARPRNSQLGIKRFNYEILLRHSQNDDFALRNRKIPGEG